MPHSTVGVQLLLASNTWFPPFRLDPQGTLLMVTVNPQQTKPHLTKSNILPTLSVSEVGQMKGFVFPIRVYQSLSGGIIQRNL